MSGRAATSPPACTTHTPIRTPARNPATRTRRAVSGMGGRGSAGVGWDLPVGGVVSRYGPGAVCGASRLGGGPGVLKKSMRCGPQRGRTRPLGGARGLAAGPAVG